MAGRKPAEEAQEPQGDAPEAPETPEGAEPQGDAPEAPETPEGAEPQGDAPEAAAPVEGETTVVMKIAISGTRNGEPWPAVGGEISLPTEEAEGYIRLGYARLPE